MSLIKKLTDKNVKCSNCEYASRRKSYISGEVLYCTGLGKYVEWEHIIAKLCTRYSEREWLNK